MKDDPQDDAQAAIEDAAIAWFVRMRGEQAPALRAEFAAWIDASPAHAAAYAWAKRHFAASDVVRKSRLLPAWRRARLGRTILITAAAAAALCAAALLSLHPIWRVTTRSDRGADAQARSALATRHGEIRAYRLADGSEITLDSDSKAQIAITGTERRVVLRAGNARFAIARASLPFIVEAGSGSVRSEQAVVDVGYHDRRDVFLQLVSGKATMRPAIRSAVYTADTESLMPGRRMRYSVDLYDPAPAPDDGVDRSAWPSGWMEYRAIRLGDLIAEANRYAARPIMLDDAALSGLMASGRFRLTDTDAFVSRIAELFGLAVAHQRDGIHLRRP